MSFVFRIYPVCTYETSMFHSFLFSEKLTRLHYPFRLTPSTNLWTCSPLLIDSTEQTTADQSGISMRPMSGTHLLCPALRRTGTLEVGEEPLMMPLLLWSRKPGLWLVTPHVLDPPPSCLTLVSYLSCSCQQQNVLSFFRSHVGTAAGLKVITASPAAAASACSR